MKPKIFRNKKAAREYILDTAEGEWSGNDADIVRLPGARRWIVRRWAQYGRSGGQEAPFDWYVLSDDASYALQLTDEECQAIMAGAPGPCPHRCEAGFLCGTPAAVGGWVCVYDGSKVFWADPIEQDRWILLHPDTGGLTYINSREHAIELMRQVAAAPDVKSANGICEIFAFDSVD